MPWFAIDDGFDTHPKVRKAGNAAAGLFCRLGAHCAKHLTEGRVDGVTARDYGTAAQLRKLVEVGMLHPDGHSCPRCPQPAAGGYVLHDYLVYNKSRAQIESAREGGRKRQAKGRDRQRENRASENRGSNRGPTEPQVNLGLPSNGAQNETRFEDGTAGQDDVSRRYPLEGVTVVPSHPLPVGTTYLQGQGGQRPSEVLVPDWAQPLVAALGQHRIDVNWRLSPMQWAAVQQLIQTRGVPFLVEQARRRWNPADPIKFASLLIKIWSEIPAPQRAPQQSRPAAKPPYCGHIDCDEITRMRDTTDAGGRPVLVRCPECHPDTRKDAA